MRQQHYDRRFGLVLGAGVSLDYGFPRWKKLVEQIAADAFIDGEALAKSTDARSQTSITQMLYQRFRERRLGEDPNEGMRPPDSERRIRRDWLELLRRHLYSTATPAEKVKDHPYLGHFVRLVRESPLTVNYNFDDRVERLVDATRSSDDNSRGYETVWEPSSQYRLTQGVIYHPNGYIPQKRGEGGSQWIVFSEEAFADQLIDSMRGNYAMLLSHLSSTTCLLLGLSLEDATLRHLLRQSALMNPDHVHYYVSVLDETKPLASDERSAVREANFAVYNLVTMFLRKEQIACLGRLLSARDDEFRFAADHEGLPIGYCYYISGAVGAGKTTTVNMCRSHAAYDEWPDPPPENLFLRHTELGADGRQKIDAWIDTQFAKKNVLLLEDQYQIQIVDRCPLDPLAFTPPNATASRATAIRAAVRPNRSARRVREGQVLILSGDPAEMAARAMDQQRGADSVYLTNQQNLIRRVYGDTGVVVVDTRGLTPAEVTRNVMHIVHLGEYVLCPLEDRLESFITGSLSLTAVTEAAQEPEASEAAAMIRGERPQ